MKLPDIHENLLNPTAATDKIQLMKSKNTVGIVESITTYEIISSDDGGNLHKPSFMFWWLFMAFLIKLSLRHRKMCLKQINSKVKAESDKYLAVYQLVLYKSDL